MHFNKISIARAFCRSLSVLFLLAAMNNDGFSGITFGLPFALYLMYDAYRIHHQQRLQSIVLVCLAVIPVLMSQYQRQSWHWYYPALGQTLHLTQDVPIIHNPYFPNTLQISPADAATYTLPKGSTLTLTRQYISGHPDFGTSYLFEVRLNDPALAETFTTHAQLMPVRMKELGQDSIYSWIDRSSIYLSDYGLGTLPTDRKMDIMPRFHLLSILLIYPILFPALLLLNIIRKFAHPQS